MMYSLLRDNKQSGPYSLDQLKTMGLKAYDLVWVDGKSAAWRYPSEIAELKAFAPVVEEQPFDRFFKKPAAVKPAAEAESVYATSPVQESASLTSLSATTFSATSISAGTNSATTTSSPHTFPDDFSSTPRKRNIYVTMPGGVSNRAMPA